MDKVYSMLGLGKKAGYIVSGETGCIQEIKRKKSKLVILAEDSSENTKKKIIDLCNRYQIEYCIFGKKEDLGMGIGKSLTATITIKDPKFAKAILDIL